MLKAFFARRRDAKTRKLVGIQTFKYRAYNPIIGAVVYGKATAQFFQTDAGIRTVEVSDNGLLKEPVVIAWLEWGETPLGMVRCA